MTPPAAAPREKEDPWKPIQHLLEPLPSYYHDAVLDEFVRSERYPESIAYTAADNSPQAYQKFLWNLYRLVGDLRGKRVLELGSGPGVVVEALRRLGGVEAVGVEADLRFVEFARAHEVPLIQGTLEVVPGELAGKPFDLTFSHWFLDALAKVEIQSDGTVRNERRLNHIEELQVLKTLAALTPAGAWSIHATRGRIPFKDEEFRQAGFEIIEVNEEHTFIVLRKTAPPADTLRVEPSTPAPAKTGPARALGGAG